MTQNANNADKTFQQIISKQTTQVNAALTYAGVASFAFPGYFYCSYPTLPRRGSLAYSDMNWETASSLATAAGTLVLALATFSAVRSANKAARVAEQALLVGTRPLLVASRLDDVQQKVFYGDGKHELLEGGRGVAEHDSGNVYLGISVRNAGRGIAVIHGWQFLAGRQTLHDRPDPAAFRPQQRDLYVAQSDIGFWQAAFRDPADPRYDDAVAAVLAGDVLTIDVLYGDHEGGQRAITRFTLQRRVGNRDDGQQTAAWLASVIRHWNLDRPDPR